jgi:hypothetical protein
MSNRVYRIEAERTCRSAIIYLLSILFVATLLLSHGGPSGAVAHHGHGFERHAATATDHTHDGDRIAAPSNPAMENDNETDAEQAELHVHLTAFSSATLALSTPASAVLSRPIPSRKDATLPSAATKPLLEPPSV